MLKIISSEVFETKYSKFAVVFPCVCNINLDIKIKQGNVIGLNVSPIKGVFLENVVEKRPVRCLDEMGMEKTNLKLV